MVYLSRSADASLQAFNRVFLINKRGIKQAEAIVKEGRGGEQRDVVSEA
jgi:hypothetical protein